jgi:hypothetical protein
MKLSSSLWIGSKPTTLLSGSKIKRTQIDKIQEQRNGIFTDKVEVDFNYTKKTKTKL